MNSRHALDILGAITVVSPPSAGGVEDYARTIAEASGARFFSFKSISLPSNVKAVLRGDGHTLFIQVSHYGYHTRGIPLELLNWAKLRKHAGERLGCYFHELYAFGPPWRSSFWLSPLQRYITIEMVRLSDFWMANQQAAARWLLRVGGDKPHEVLPVFSNVGESAQYLPARTSALVVFGSAGSRERAYRSAGPDFLDWAARRGLEVHDVGARIADQQLSGRLRRHGVKEHGTLPKHGVSELLSRAMYGVVAYPLEYVAKSGVFAAYCSHGVCPLVISRTYPQVDGLLRGTHYLGWPGPQGEAQDCSSVGRHAFEWYSGHSIRAHARALLRLSGQAVE